MKKLLLASVMFLTACQPHISEMENRLAESIMANNPKATIDSSWVEVCKIRVIVKMLGFNWRAFLKKKFANDDISYVMRAWAKTPLGEQMDINGFTGICKKDITILYSAKD